MRRFGENVGEVGLLGRLREPRERTHGSSGSPCLGAGVAWDGTAGAWGISAGDRTPLRRRGRGRSRRPTATQSHRMLLPRLFSTLWVELEPGLAPDQIRIKR